MPFIKLDDATIQRLLDSDDAKEELRQVIMEAEASNDSSRIQNTLGDVIREIQNNPDSKSEQIN